MAGRTVGLAVILDAPTFVSAALKVGSLPERMLLRAVDSLNRLLLSQAVEDEHREVIFRPKFDRFVSRERRQRLLDIAVAAAEGVEPTAALRECSDPKDDKCLELAPLELPTSIVTGDARHLLPLHAWRGVLILRPQLFLALVAPAG